MKKLLCLILALALFAPAACAEVEFSGDHLYAMYPLLQAAANCVDPQAGFALDQNAFDAILSHMALYGKYAVQPGDYETREEGASFLSGAMLARMATDCFGGEGAAFDSLTPSERVKQTDGGYLVYPDAGTAYRNVDAYAWTRVSPLEVAVSFRLTDWDDSVKNGYFLLEEYAPSRFGFVLRDMLFTGEEPQLQPFSYAGLPDFGTLAGELLAAEADGEGLLVTLRLADGSYVRASMPWYGEVTADGKTYDADMALEKAGGALLGPCELVVEDGQGIELRMISSDIDKP